ncbi:MAG: response regulator transcription factor [Deltaproteobacteria bacterium]|nr:response regulator transcription factor [Deltaproteobacteria bacterium]
MSDVKYSNNRDKTILVVEDDKSVREGLVMNLQLQGYKVISCNDGDEGMKMAFDAKPDLVILDIMLPGWSGLDILSELRSTSNDVSVLLLSARDRTEHKIEGLEIGADDYVTKPFELSELLARVEALLRRRRGYFQKEANISFGTIVIEPDRRKVTVEDKRVELSMKEYELLLLFAKNPGRPFDRESILSSVWGWDFDGTSRTVDNFIMSLRQKIEKNPQKPQYIKTVRQVGYKLDA